MEYLPGRSFFVYRLDRKVLTVMDFLVSYCIFAYKK